MLVEQETNQLLHGHPLSNQHSPELQPVPNRHVNTVAHNQDGTFKHMDWDYRVIRKGQKLLTATQVVSLLHVTIVSRIAKGNNQ